MYTKIVLYSTYNTPIHMYICVYIFILINLIVQIIIIATL